MLLTFWLANALRATAACNFSTTELQKVVRSWGVFHILTCKCASRQRRAIFRHWNFQKWAKTVSFLAFWLGNVLRATAACHFSCLLWAATSAPASLASLLFDLADPHLIEKTQHFAASLTFRPCGSSFYWLSRNCIFFLLILLLFSAFHLLTLLLCSAFQLSILSEVRLLNFLWLCVHISFVYKNKSIVIPPLQLNTVYCY